MNKNISLRKISYHLPKNVETNEELKMLHPDWDVDKVSKKTGIYKRFIADKEETSLDLGFKASKNLFKEWRENPVQFVSFTSHLPVELTYLLFESSPKVLLVSRKSGNDAFAPDLVGRLEDLCLKYNNACSNSPASTEFS